MFLYILLLLMIIDKYIASSQSFYFTGMALYVLDTPTQMSQSYVCIYV